MRALVAALLVVGAGASALALLARPALPGVAVRAPSLELPAPPDRASGSQREPGREPESEDDAEEDAQPIYPPPPRPLSLALPMGETMRVDLTQRRQAFLGWGMGLHPGDVPTHRALLAELDVDLARMEVGPGWNHLEEKIPAGATDAELDAYIARNFDADSPHRLSGARWAFKLLGERGVDVILVTFELPWHWLEKGFWRRLRADRVRDWARFQAALLLYLKRHGMVPRYIELANEPDGNWNGQITPERYRELVRIARDELDRRGVGQVRILGPGLAFLRRENVAGRWINAMGRDVARDLWGWSTHAWDEVDYRRARPEFLRGCWRPFNDAIAPHGDKPVLVTEYATEITRYGTRDIASPRDDATRCAADLPAYATRVIANSLVHLERGAAGLVVYRLADHDWMETTWGVFRDRSRGGGARPLRDALRAVLPHVPDGAHVLAATWYQPDDLVQMGAFVHPEGDGLTLVLANAGDSAEARTLRLVGAPGPPRTALVAGFPAQLPSPAWRADGDAWTTRVRLPAHAVLTVVVRFADVVR